MNPFRLRNKNNHFTGHKCDKYMEPQYYRYGATRKKITRSLDLKRAFNILIDTRALIEDVEKIFFNHKVKKKLGHLKHIRTYTKTKAIIVMYDENLVKVKDLKVMQAGQLVSFLVVANNDCIDFTTMYAPADENNPKFMLKAK